MPTFQYKAKTPKGEVVNGSLAAGDRRLALAQLGRMGYFPLTVEAAGADAATATPKQLRGHRGRVATRDVLLFTNQLCSLLRSGMALSDALGALERRSSKRNLRIILGQVRSDITQGRSLSDALAKYPKVFPRLYVNLVRAGEASGTLDEILTRLQQHFEQQAAVREKVTAALIYPAIIILFGIGTITFFMMVMVPKFAEMFKEMNRVMPLPTRILIAVSHMATSYWWIPLLLAVAAAVLYRQRARTPEGRLAIDALKMRLPVIGRIVKTSAFVQFARTLATLLENGVPVLTALQIVEDTITNRVIANEIRQARTRVTDGTSISQPLAQGKIFPPLLLDMLSVGEASGEVVPALKTIADTYENELSYTLKVFTTLLEPAIIIFMAMIVGGIVVSVLMAVFDITSGIGK